MSEINSKSVDNSIWHNLLANRINRRSLFKGAAIAGIAAAAGPIEMRTAAAASTSANDSVGLTKAGEPIDPTLFFKPIAPSTEDKFLLPEGFSQQVVQLGVVFLQLARFSLAYLEGLSKREGRLTQRWQ